MGKESFFYPETQPLFTKLEQISQRSGVSRGQAFEDSLTGIVCALAAETMEDEYLAMVERHKEGTRGRRGIDLMGEVMALLVNTMERCDGDILGDLFQSAISYGEAGQYLSPESVARLLAEMSVDPDTRPTDGRPVLINDPCCGTGRMLLEASNINPHAELVGTDIDARCANITSINLGLRGRYGWITCGNSLSGDMRFAYRIGAFFHDGPNGRRRGVIREVAPEQTPVPLLQELTRDESGKLFAEQDVAVATEAESPDAEVLLKIIEIPRWLTRMELALGASDDMGENAPDQDRAVTPVTPETDAKTQQRLF